MRFSTPPVTEVALTVQFAGPVVDLSALAQFTELVREDYPTQTHRPPLPRMQEEFDVTIGEAPFELRIEPQAQLPRTWLLSQSQETLIQVQQDRLSLNWRRLHSASVYPTYEGLRAEFSDQLARLVDVSISGRNANDLSIDLCEVGYFNHIDPGVAPTFEGAHPDLAGIVNRFRRTREGRSSASRRTRTSKLAGESRPRLAR